MEVTVIIEEGVMYLSMGKPRATIVQKDQQRETDTDEKCEVACMQRKLRDENQFLTRNKLTQHDQELKWRALKP